MQRMVILIVFLLMFSVSSIIGAAGGAVSGKVEILETGAVPGTVGRQVLVYLDGIETAAPASLLERTRELKSQDKTFVPRVHVVPVGGEIFFPNVDEIMHNVFSITKGNRFDLGLYKSGAGKTHVFETPGLVRIYCNIHPQMSAFVLVRDNPYFTWTEPDGSFRISDVPAGDYTIKVWSEQGEAEQSIRVGAEGLSGVQFAVDVSRYTRQPHLNKFGKPYKRKRGRY